MIFEYVVLHQGIPHTFSKVIKFHFFMVAIISSCQPVASTFQDNIYLLNFLLDRISSSHTFLRFYITITDKSYI